MSKTQCSLALIALFMGLTHSWEIAVAIGDRIEFYLNDTKTYVAHLDVQKITALAYDEVHDALLYVDKQNGNDAICGYDISFRKYECYMKNSGRDIHGLAFDPIRQYLFFTDMKEKSINRLSLGSGSKNDVQRNLLIKLDEGIPTDIAVDSCREYIYWINTNIATSTIERARYDLSQREVVIHAEYKMDLHSLAIDQQTKKIYWMMPKDNTISYLYSADLEGTNMKKRVRFTFVTVPVTHPKALTVLKEHAVVIDWAANYTPKSVWKYPKPSLVPDNYDSYLEISNAKDEAVLVGNYKINEQLEGIQECQHLTRYEGPFCVHGVKVNGQSICKCTTGYTGERCDLSVCANYCINGNCSLDGEGLPECSCNSGYSGDRCEVSACHKHCTNNGTCSLDVDGQPVCQCIDNYTGDRCEVADCQNYCLQGECTLKKEGPTCRCNSGYSGDRCEVNICYEYCLNNGTCDYDEDNVPFCQCLENYYGDRCEFSSFSNEEESKWPNKNSTSGYMYYPTLSNMTLAELLANWQKPVAIIPENK